MTPSSSRPTSSRSPEPTTVDVVVTPDDTPVAHIAEALTMITGQDALDAFHRWNGSEAAAKEAREANLAADAESE